MLENIQTISKSDPRFESAKVLLRTALANSKHADHCAKQKFWQHNKHLPTNHPGWKASPGCSCWVGDAETFLNLN